MLEKNCNSKNGKSITPSIRTYEKIAHGVGLTVDSLMKLINGDERVSLISNDISSLKNKSGILILHLLRPIVPELVMHDLRCNILYHSFSFPS